MRSVYKNALIVLYSNTHEGRRRSHCLPESEAMSVRVRAQELVEHVTIRGTKVSTSMVAPSLMHVSVVQTFGMPGRHGNVICDNHTVYIRFDTHHTDQVHVWAYKNDPTEADEWTCVLL